MSCRVFVVVVVDDVGGGGIAIECLKFQIPTYDTLGKFILNKTPETIDDHEHGKT